MARRVVVLGGAKDSKVPALEVSVSDACALRDGDTCRVTLSNYGDELADATVLIFHDKYLNQLAGAKANELSTFELAWKNLLALPRHPDHQPFEITLRG